MTKYLLLLLFPVSVMAQNQNNNWFFGAYLGMQFNGGTMKVIPPKTSAMYSAYGSSSYSDPATGNLLFYTNGSAVYNRFHKQMPNGFNINDDNNATHTIAVPVPGSTRFYYIFSSATAGGRIYYSKIDMQLDNGRGDVVESRNLIGNTFDLQFTLVKQLYDHGYWLITHGEGNNRFYAYRVGKNGLEPNPVISVAGKSSYPNTSYLRGKMISSSNGEKLIFTAGTTVTTECFAQLFYFDKRCGTVTAGPEFPPIIIQAAEMMALPAFSPNDKLVYMSWAYNSGQNFLVQYDLTDPSPFPITISANINETGDLQLAPDGKIYVASALQGAVTGLISEISNPNQIGTLCNFKDKNIDLLAGSFEPLFVEHFPSFMMDISPQKEGYVKPEINIKNVCFGDQSVFNLKEKFAADSFYWKLGDGTRSDKLETNHVYALAGTYTVSFNWYVCGIQYSTDTIIKVTPKPVVNLGADTTLCAGTSITLTGPPGCDEYKWSTGASASGIIVTSPGFYHLYARNGGCSSSDDISIGYYPSLWLALGDEYFICDDQKELVRLDAGEGFESYKWIPTGDSSQWIDVASVNDYFVVVKDFRGCSGNDGTKVKRRCPVTVYFPNAFTPNGDGVNDEYNPIGKDVTAFEMTIYDGWGQAIFHTDDMEQQWDGTSNGKIVPSGVYIYKAQFSGYRNKKITTFNTTGNISVLK